MISRISIIGSGNVANQLAIAFSKENVEVSHIYSRNNETAKVLANTIDATQIYSLQDLPQQLCIICVPDDEISNVVEQINDNIPVAYTSGSVELQDIPKRREIGVFYPLQTFSKGRIIDFFNVPFFIESTDEYFATTLFDLAWKISKEVNYANSEERKKMHIAAVMVNNFTNHLIYQAQKYSEENNIDFKHLQPLLKETFEKLEDHSAYNSQTGPARRGDKAIIAEHLSQLKGNQRKIYEVITSSIIASYDKL